MPNPYAAGGMVTDPKMFFGREDILRTITTRLAKKQSTSVVGQRRIGKSSLLYHVAHPAQLPQDVRLVLVPVDMHDSRFHTAADFFKASWPRSMRRWGTLSSSGRCPPAPPLRARLTG